MSTDSVEQVRQLIQNFSDEQFRLALQGTRFAAYYELGEFVKDNNPYIACDQVQDPDLTKAVFSGQLKDYNCSNPWNLERNGPIKSPTEDNDTWYFSTQRRP